MQESSGGEGPLTLPAAQPNSRNGITRIEHAVVTRARPGIAWRVLTDWECWSQISDRYRTIEWNGKPWSPGSRLRVALLRPLKATVDRVITACESGQSLAWINHVIGFTMEQWVFFQPIVGGGTRVFTWLEYTGPGQIIEGRSVQETIEEYLGEWYEAFRIECDQAASSS
ncbi:MAG TPA: hypothetical protein VJO35_17070 [Terriglobales bacterium]|nr:hypothetical protein [Terriglobales bacterium]